MNTRPLTYILLFLILSSIVWANNFSKDKIKPGRPLPPPAEQLRRVEPLPMKVYQPGQTEFPSPDDLRLVGIENKEVSLAWNNPELMNGYFDDFESHGNFVINSPGTIGWSYLDIDQGFTYTMQSCTFPNQGQKMAFIVMNPGKTSPAIENPVFQPHSGNKMLAAFTVDGGNNDWIISPQLAFDEEFQLSFWAKTYHPSYGFERIRVGYSTTGKQPADFTFVSAGKYEEIPFDWTLKSYKIPAKAKYIAINCVSHEAFALLIDDIFIGTNLVRPKLANANKLVGFNLYRDGVKINKAPITGMNFNDLVPEYRRYDYFVTALYQSGQESKPSDVLSVNVPDIRLLPFQDSFDKWNFTEGQWELPEGELSSWKVGYYEWGLVNPCASYRYSLLTNYSQSLQSKQLYTEHPENVFLRFNLLPVNYKNINQDFLAVEVSSDKISWNLTDDISMSSLEKEWQIKQYDLSDKLKGKEFYVRFRVHGKSAEHIDYWYVDDIKIWNPEWTQASLMVSHKGQPIQECEVIMTNSDGVSLKKKTDTAGKVMMDKVEAGLYKVVIAGKGYNLYESDWNILSGQENNWQVILTAPKVALDPEKLQVDLKAEETAQRTVVLKNNGDGPVHWKLDRVYPASSGNIKNRWAFQKSFRASGDLQSCIGFDGEYYYTGSHLFAGIFNKYDRNGHFIEEFTIPGIYTGVYDLTYDGNYFYMSNSKNSLYKVDMRSRELLEQITIKSLPSLEIRHCSYDPRTDRFWVGGWNSICSIDRTGLVKQSLREIIPNSSGDVAGSAFDEVTPGGPYLWLACVTADKTSKNQYDQALIRQLNLSTMQITDTSYFLGNLPDFIPGNPSTGPVQVIGLFASFEIEPGALTLTGMLTNSPSSVFNIKVCDLDNWLNFNPRQGNLGAGGEQAVVFDFNALEGKLGETYNAAVRLVSDPQNSLGLLEVGYTVTDKPTYARPQEVKAEASGEAEVTINWKAGSGLNRADGYILYRNGVQLTDNLVKALEYKDNHLLWGTYTYVVKAVYGKELSAGSDGSSVFVKVGMPYYPPMGLTSQVIANKKVNLSWKSPEDAGKETKVLRWDNGVNADVLGLGSGGFFFAGTLWEYEDLIDYRGMNITEVEVFVNDFTDNLSLQIRKDNKIVCTQPVPQSDIKYGDFNVIKVKTPVVIEPGYSYNIGFVFAHQAGKYPLGLDSGPVVKGKGNLLSENGTDWFAATNVGASDGNFNIAFRVDPSGSKTSSESMSRTLSPTQAKRDLVPAMKLVQRSSDIRQESKFKSESVALKGFNIYRNKEKVNSEPVTGKSYQDVCNAAGVYSYQVSAVYDFGESVLSTPTDATILSIENYYSPRHVWADVELNRNINLRWDYPTKEDCSLDVSLSSPTPGLPGYPDFINSWDTRAGGEAGVASDGKYIYTSTWSVDGMINRYSLSGKYLESFIIEGVGGLRDITCDGVYFYGGDTKNTIYKMDFNEQKLVDRYSVSEIVRHCCYIPDLDGGRGGFEVGDWETSIYVTMNGAKIGTGPAYKGAFGTAYFNGKLYVSEQGAGENKYTISVYDFKTLEKTGSIDLGLYGNIQTDHSTSGGGLSVFTSREGITALAVSLQNTSRNSIALLELSTLLGVEGYNIFCNGAKLNDRLLKNRGYQDYKSEEGIYQYQVETVYADEKSSEKTSPVSVRIISSENCDVPVDLKALQSTYGYNVLLSFADADAFGADLYEGLEESTSGTLFAKQGWTNRNQAGEAVWKVDGSDSYDGVKALISVPAAQGLTSNWLITPVQEYDQAFSFSFVARNRDDHRGKGKLRILTSTGSNEAANFIPFQTVETSESWNKYTFTLAKEVRYIAIEHTGDEGAPQLVDAISISLLPAGSIYGYDIFRNGRQLNEKPVTGVSYVDRNVLPGDYRYQARAHYYSSCISDLTEPVDISVEYGRPCQAPRHLVCEQKADGVALGWESPALSDAVYVGWHSGKNKTAAGMPSGGCYFGGSRWSNSELKSFEGLYVSDVEIYVNNPPDALFLLIYEGNKQVYQQYIPQVVEQSFNTIRLDKPHRLNVDKELKVIFYVEHNQISVPLGVDEGPAIKNKGNLYSKDGLNWSTLSDNEIDGNWNLSVGFRAYAGNPAVPAEVSPENRLFIPKLPANGEQIHGLAATRIVCSAVNKFNGYFVYRNNERLNPEPQLGNFYLDSSVSSELYNEYLVTAVYDQCGEVESDAVILPNRSGIKGYPVAKLVIKAENGSISVEGAAEGSVIELITPDGSRRGGVISDGTPVRLKLTSGEAGVYFVKITGSNGINRVEKVVVIN